MLTEILQERVDKAPGETDPEAQADAARIRKGLGEMAEEVEVKLSPPEAFPV